jgi:iron complex outermembrane recepter protein
VRSLRYIAPALALLAGLGAAAGGALAADSAPADAEGPPAAAGTGKSEVLAEVTVTARRREEDIQKVPAVVTAIGAKDLESRSITTESDLQTAVPGLTVRETEGQNQLTFSIRGQTVDAFTGSATAVVPYVNEVQLNTGGAATFFDLNSIQVLKGPQGTLFGRNATGGAILFTTTKPTNELGGYIDVSGGNYRYYEEKGAFNLPIVSDKVLLRLAFDVADRDGYVRNVFDNTNLGALDRASGRASLTLRPLEGLESLTVAEYDRSGGNNTGSQIYTYNKCGSTSGNGIPLACSADALFGPGLDAAVGVPGAWAAYLAANPKANPGGMAAVIARQQQLGFWAVDSAVNSFHREHDFFVTNTTSYNLNPDVTLKNIFGYSKSHSHDQVTETGTPYIIEATDNEATGAVGNVVTIKNVSDELQLQGKVDALTYIFGLYYLKTDADTYYPQTYFDVSPIIPGTATTSHWTTTDTSKAVFAQGTYDLSSLVLEGLSFTAGVRYTWERIGLNQLPDGNSYPSDPQSVEFHKPSWTVGFDEQITSGVLAYVQSRGSWRSGGLNGVAPPVLATAAGGGDEFLPETTHDVEVGLKLSGEFLGLPAHFNTAVYNQWIKNVQRAEFPTVGGHSVAVTINVPSAEVTGLEIDAAVRPQDWLEIGASGAFTGARFTSNESLIFGTLYQFGPYADAPRYTGTLYSQVTLPAPDAVGTMRLRADLYGQTEQYFSNNNATIIPGTRLPGYGLVNLRYDWSQLFGSGFSLGIFAKNVANRGYYVGGLAQGSSLGVNAATVGVPRMYGLEINWSTAAH